MGRIDAAWVNSHFEGWNETVGRLKSCLGPGKGAIVACPHMGAWDGVGIALRLFDIPMFFIAAPQKNRRAPAAISSGRLMMSSDCSSFCRK